MTKSLFYLAILFAFSGCASIFEGTTQQILINTTPAGADCAINRQGQTIARVSPTPGGVDIKKTKDDLTIVCNKPGYQETTFKDKSGADWVTGVDVIGGLILGPISWGIDSASGADNKYDSPVNITLPTNSRY